MLPEESAGVSAMGVGVPSTVMVSEGLCSDGVVSCMVSVVSVMLASRVD